MERFIKLTKLIGIFTLSITLVGCASTKVIAPTDSFVRLYSDHELNVCASKKIKEDKGWQSSGMPECIQYNVRSSASGSIIDHYKDPSTKEDKSLVLSVAHFCSLSEGQLINMIPSEGLQQMVQLGLYEIKSHKISQQSLTTIYSKNYRVIKNIASDAQVDVCLLESERLPVKRLPILKSNAEYGERILNMAAPWGYFNPPNIFIDEGLYLGECGNTNTCLNYGSFAISGVYAGQGSSGSPILVRRAGRWYIAGIIHTVKIAPFGGTYLPMGASVEQIQKVIQSNFIPYKNSRDIVISDPKEPSMK